MVAPSVNVCSAKYPFFANKILLSDKVKTVPVADVDKPVIVIELSNQSTVFAE
jgi:hypothetical protein